MKLYNSALLLFVLWVLPQVVYPQMRVSRKKDVLRLNQSTLAVVMLQENEKELKKLKNQPNEIEKYKSSIESFNKILKEAVMRDWSFSDEIVFITEDDAKKLKKEKAASYCLLEPAKMRSYKLGEFPNQPLLGTSMPYALRSMSGDFIDCVQLSFPSKRAIAQVPLPETELTAAMMTFILQQFQNQLNDCLEHGVNNPIKLRKHIKKKTPSLRNKTLLLSKELINGDLEWAIENNQLSEKYPFAYKLVSQEELERLILKKEEGYAYALTMPAGVQSGATQLYHYMLVDASDGSAIYLSGKPKGFSGKIDEYHLYQAAKDARK